MHEKSMKSLIINRESFLKSFRIIILFRQLKATGIDIPDTDRIIVKIEKVSTKDTLPHIFLFVYAFVCYVRTYCTLRVRKGYHVCK